MQIMSSPPPGTSSGDADQYEWELCRENVKPMKHGRRVATINKSLTQVVCNAEKVATAKLEEVLAECDASEEPLHLCLDFCTWFEDSYPSGKQRLFYSLLWKIVHKYIQNGTYSQDPRTLKIWEKLADNSMGHGYEVYQHAHQFGCLLECSEFYIRWSRELEDRGSIANAREILHKGRLHGAPSEPLDEEEDQMEMRELRRQVDRARTAEEEDSDEWEEEENESRRVFTRVSTLEGGAVPVVRLPSIVGEQGPRRLEGLSHKKQEHSEPQNFEVFEDEEDNNENYIESIFDLHNEVHSGHIERYALKDNNSIKLIPTTSNKKLPDVPSSFTVWRDDEDDEKENVDPSEKKEEGRCKQKFAIAKKFIAVSFEEAMAEKYEANAVVRKKLTFDDDEE